MVRKVLSYIGMTVVVLLLVQTMTVTYQLSKIDSGLSKSLDSTSRLLSIQRSIIQKNEHLQAVVSTTKAMDQQLGQTLRATETVHVHIARINDLNASTLKLNQEMVQYGNKSSSDLMIISQEMSHLTHAMGELHAVLGKLSYWLQQDQSHLEQIKGYTEQMNQKTPGVTP